MTFLSATLHSVCLLNVPFGWPPLFWSNVPYANPFPCLPRADPNAFYNIKASSDGVPTIQVDLASPQSPDSVNMLNEFSKRGATDQGLGQREGADRDEDQGLMMKSAGKGEKGEEEGGNKNPGLMRCLSDPGPSNEDEEDEPFLP